VHKLNEKLYVVPAGPVPPNPADLLESDGLDMFLADAEKRFDYIFIDTSPVNVVTDPLVLAKKASVLLVARAGRTSYKSVAQALSKLEQAGAASILGIVINGVRARKRNRYINRYYSTKR
jgi:capsular exopolysaccharide synthesis family protein